MTTELYINKVTDVRFSTVAYESLPGGCFVITVGGVDEYGGSVVLSELKLQVWDPIAWDRFRDIERVMAGPLRDPGPPPSEAPTSPQPLEVPRVDQT